MPLTLRSAQRTRPGESDKDDYEVLSGRMPLGRIYRRSGPSGHAFPWVWSIDAVQASPGVMVTAGSVNTLEEAKAEVAKNWRKWLAWAALQET